MAGIRIEELLKRYDKRYHSLSLSEDVLDKFGKNVDLYLKKANIAIENNESEEHLKNLTNSFLKTMYSTEKYEINTEKKSIVL